MSLQPCFDGTTAQRIGEPEHRLADPPRPPVGVEEPVIARPGVARYAGRRLVFLELSLQGGSLRCPAQASARKVCREGDALSAPSLLELSLLPEPHRALLAALPGLPTFYVAPIPASLTDPQDGQLVEAGLALASGGVVQLGCIFPDHAELAPYAWLALLGEALAGDPAQAAWLGQLAVYADERRCRVLDHAGFAMPVGTPLVVRRELDGGDLVAQRLVALGGDADLEQALAAAGAGVPASLFDAPPGQRTAVSWPGAAPPGDTPLPIHVLYRGAGAGAGERSAPGQALRLPALPAGQQRLTLQLLELAAWYPAEDVPLDDDLDNEGANPRGVARYRPGSRVVPLIDGVSALQPLAADLRAAHGEGMGAHATGWAVLDFVLDRAHDDRTFVDLLAEIHEQGGVARVLATTFINPRNEDLDTAVLAALLLILLLYSGTTLAFLHQTLDADTAGIAVWLATPAVIGFLQLLLSQVLDLADLLAKAFPDNAAAVDDLNARARQSTAHPEPRKLALYAENPMRLADNPLADGMDNPLFGLEADVDQVGVWHNKMQIVRRPPHGDEDGYAAYLGGMDINPNRVDTPTHAGGSPYHDVHARVTGPAVIDAMRSFAERWRYDAAHPRNADDDPQPPDTSPLTALLPLPPDPAPGAAAGPHLARIGRTYYGPRGPAVLPYAPAGDAGIYKTMVAAIQSARDVIYIEDQYFTPTDPFVEALADAAARCRRLLILMPSGTDQLFGDLRQQHVLAELRAAWQDRMLAGAILRRPKLAAAGRVAAKGRAYLGREALAGDDVIYLEPPARVPEMPCWLWIDGEMMLARAAQTLPIDGRPMAQVEVLRGSTSGDAKWRGHRRRHQRGAPVTCSSLASIYVHAKTMMVDDLFLSIGSCNVNRRGFFCDGEINVFAIPEALAGARDNPARSARTQLWAEHLGLPPAMGATLLADPVAAFDLFWRSHLLGNRFIPISSLDLKLSLGAQLDIVPMSFFTLLAALADVGTLTANGIYQRIWNLGIEPSSATDPAPLQFPPP
jgi:phosphatidylserine/phosphatidylglycerophosphate/cardiolipin synthase-like enzyme